MTVVATDDANAETTELAVMVTVTDVGPAISGDAAVDVAENTTAVATYTSEPGVMWSLKPGGDADDFTIANGVLSFSAPDGPDFENPADSDEDNVYHVTVIATQGAETAEKAVVVTVTDVGPAIPSGNAAVDVTEGTTLVGFYTSEPGVMWSLKPGGDADDFTIANGVLSISTPDGPDYETPTDRADAGGEGALDNGLPRDRGSHDW